MAIIRGKSIDATRNTENIASGISGKHQPVPGDRRKGHCLATQGVADCDVPYLRAICCIDRDHVRVSRAAEQPAAVKRDSPVHIQWSRGKMNPAAPQIRTYIPL